MSERAHTDMVPGEVEGLRAFYDALGLGFPLEGRTLFGDDDVFEPDVWRVTQRGHRLGSVGAGEISNDELFALPAGWEITRVVAHTFDSRHTRRGDVVTVGGHLYCRPRGRWGNERFPFLHIWTMCAGRALRFEDFLERVELKRMSRVEGCPAA